MLMFHAALLHLTMQHAASQLDLRNLTDHAAICCFFATACLFNRPDLTWQEDKALNPKRSTSTPIHWTQNSLPIGYIAVPFCGLY